MKYDTLKLGAFVIVADGKAIQCAYPDCPIRAIEALHLDHIRNDGARHRRKHNGAGGVHTYQWVLKNPGKAQHRLQILCSIHDRMKQRLGSLEAVVDYIEKAEHEELLYLDEDY